MLWPDIIMIARSLPRSTSDKERVTIAGDVVARLLENSTVVAFAVDDDAERDRLLASEPYFTNDRYRNLPVVLVRLDDLDPAACRERLGAKPEVVQEVPVIAAREPARCYFLSLWSEAGPGEPPKHERRRFFRYSAKSVLDWFAAGWNEGGEDWPPKLRNEERGDFTQMFSAVFEDGAVRPKTRDEILANVRKFIDADAEPHFVHGHTDDDEGTDVEYFIFDDAFLKTPGAADRLPHPDRGKTDDRYPALFAK